MKKIDFRFGKVLTLPTRECFNRSLYFNLQRDDIKEIVKNSMSNKGQAENFSRFIWKMVEAIDEDEENSVMVLGSIDNTEILPDISYEITKLMK